MRKSEYENRIRYEKLIKYKKLLNKTLSTNKNIDIIRFLNKKINRIENFLY